MKCAAWQHAKLSTRSSRKPCAGNVKPHDGVDERVVVGSVFEGFSRGRHPLSDLELPLKICLWPRANLIKVRTKVQLWNCRFEADPGSFAVHLCIAWDQITLWAHNCGIAL